MRAKLDDLYPNWFKEMRDLNAKTMNLTIVSREKMLESMKQRLGPTEYDKFFDAKGTFKG